MSKFLRPCLECGTLAHGSRCSVHQAELDRKNQQRKDTYERRRRKAALYDSNYRKQAKAVKASAIACHICNKPFVYGDRIEADHIDAGNPNSQLAAAHRLCNQRRGSKPL